jgi:two-component sensor histidine kinase
MDIIIIVLVISIIFQLTAAFYALMLIKLTGKKISWILISIALILMTVRRIVPLYNIYLNESYQLNIENEVIGLILSFLLLIGVIGIKSIFVERILAENKIEKLLKEKELLLREVHHRIKNMMSILKSVLVWHASNIKDKSAIEALEDAGSRIQSMAVLYDKLYRDSGYDQLSIKQYLEALVDKIVTIFPKTTEIKINKNIDDFILDTERLQSLGIIINELLTNIMKYAFCGQEKGEIDISVTLYDKNVKVIISDDGKGIPETIDLKNSTGFGLMLVNALTKKLDGNINIERGGGSKFILEFSL